MTHSKILLKLRQNTCFVGHVYNLKTAQSSKYWHVGGNRLLLLTKNALMKSGQTNWAGPSPPSLGQNPKEQLLIFVKASLTLKPADTRSNNN